jgi:hypothetical protein
MGLTLDSSIFSKRKNASFPFPCITSAKIIVLQATKSFIGIIWMTFIETHKSPHLAYISTRAVVLVKPPTFQCLKT